MLDCLKRSWLSRASGGNDNMHGPTLLPLPSMGPNSHAYRASDIGRPAEDSGPYPRLSSDALNYASVVVAIQKSP